MTGTSSGIFPCGCVKRPSLAGGVNNLLCFPGRLPSRGGPSSGGARAWAALGGSQLCCMSIF